MTAEQLIIGNKYVPFQKTAGESFEDSFFIRNNYDFLYYRGIDPSSHRHTFGSSERGSGGGFYNPEDVYEYIEEHNGIRRGMAVTIINDGYTFSTYADMFEQLRFANKRRNDAWDNDTEGVVFAISKVPDGRFVFAVRHSSGKECLIEADGIRLVDYVVSSLPTKWAIKINPSNMQDLIEWRAFRIDSTDGYILCDIPENRSHSLPHNRGFSVININDYPEYTLITDEQFYNLIINKTQTMPQTPQDAPQDAPQETKQYPKTAEGLYDMQLDMLNLKVGNVVKVTHKMPSYSMGWDNSWAEEMDSMIGQECIVESISSVRSGVRLKGSHCHFPPYSLEFVRGEEPKRIFSYSYGIDESITGSMEVGGEIITFEKPIDKLSGSDVKWLVQLLKDAEVNTRYDVERISRM